MSVIFETHYYPYYKYNPKLSFDDYFVSIGGLFGLWNGLSFYDIRVKLTIIFDAIISKTISVYINTNHIFLQSIMKNCKRSLKVYFDILQVYSRIKFIIF